MTTSSPFKHVAIVGLGLIGGSLAKLIRQHYGHVALYGIGRREDTITYATDNNIIDAGSTDITAIPTTVDLVIVCTPLNILSETINTISSALDQSVTITDVGSIKAGFSADGLVLKPQHTFIPGHPMAGKEATGIEVSDAAIFNNAPYILAPTDGPTYTQLSSFISSMGCRVIELSASKHDELVALISHIPYLMAALTVHGTSTADASDQAILSDILSTGFKDTTRVAGSSSEWGRDVCEMNRDAILSGMRTIQNTMTRLMSALESGDLSEVSDVLQQAQSIRQKLVP